MQIKYLAIVIAMILIIAFSIAYINSSKDVKEKIFGNEQTEENTTKENFYETAVYNFPYGHVSPLLEDEGVTVKYANIPVENGALELVIMIDGNPGVHTSVKDTNDVNIYLYNPNGDEIARSDSPFINERIEIDENAIKENGNGTYRVKLDCYTGINVEITYEVWVNYTKNETGKEEVNENGYDCENCFINFELVGKGG